MEILLQLPLFGTQSSVAVIEHHEDLYAYNYEGQELFVHGKKVCV